MVGDEVEDGVEPVAGDVEGAVVAHKDETLVGASGHIQDQAGNSVSLTASVLVAEFLRPDSGDSGQGPVEEVEGRVHCTRFVEGKSAGKALEGEDKYNDAHKSHTSGY